MKADKKGMAKRKVCRNRKIENHRKTPKLREITRQQIYSSTRFLKSKE